ncbi:MFS transporter [Heyndrickxia oleronia]|uniref:MFS transporter n=1 Tax=Heyndrickxia oleronia TaxID=38875 RepID=UPI00242EC834|nr:MFS transporter [Heyndrickxia oleronia]MCI1592780.1 MFS transporter [Heyndrickxia oleronia]MCI1615578.1 MFS transporter [Heyndrickxia oleronia]MCI1763930.1 MFS transporter [Heyndrickxia oleronia]
MNIWKKPILLLSGIGISYLGNWIYLIALNLSILELTGSAAAVAGLYIIRPIAVLLTNTWAGSVIDRVNKRYLMIAIDLIRGVLVFCIPFIGSLWIIYTILLMINIVGSFFGPSSSVYITKLIPRDNRKRFNSIMSMTNSGAFLLGPAIAGILIMHVGTELCIIINAVTFLVCAFFIYLLPNVDEKSNNSQLQIHWKMIMKDWIIVKNFALKARNFIIIYLLFQLALLIGFSLDSQEVTFIKQNIKLSDRDYGIIVSITGIGSLTGAAVAAILAKKLQLKLYLGVGMLLTSVDYVGFYSSYNFLTATLAFIFLGFFMAFANAGYATFFQNNVPIEIMGRFSSIADMFQGVVQIGLTLLLGLFAEWFTLQLVCLIFSIVGTVLAVILLLTIFIPSKAVLFEENKEMTG